MKKLKTNGLINSYKEFIDKNLLEMSNNMVTHKIINHDGYIFLISNGIEKVSSKKEKATFVVLRDQNMNFLELSLLNKLEIIEDSKDFSENDLIRLLLRINNLISMHFSNEENIYNVESFNSNINLENFLFPIASFYEKEKKEDEDLEFFKGVGFLNPYSNYLKYFSIKIYNPVQEKKVIKGYLKLIHMIINSAYAHHEKNDIIKYLAFLIKSSSFKSLDILEKCFKCFDSSKNYNVGMYRNFLTILSLILEEKSRQVEKASETFIKYDIKAIDSTLSYLLSNELICTSHKGEIIQNYKDYLQMSKDMAAQNLMKVNFKPDDIFIAHDKLVEIYEVSKSEIDNEKILKRAMDDFVIGEYIVKFPRSVNDFIAEGKHLHHCVGSYASRHANKETTVVFIREKFFPETPFFTLEYKDGKVYQLKGKGNCNPDGQILKVANEFLKRLSLKSKNKEDLAC